MQLEMHLEKNAYAPTKSNSDSKNECPFLFEFLIYFEVWMNPI